MASKAKDLIEKLAAEEKAALEVFAPCIAGVARARVAGLARTWQARPLGWEGFGVFRPVDATTADLWAPARPAQIRAFLEPLPIVKLVTVRVLRGKSWATVPLDARAHGEKFGDALIGPRGVVMHLAAECVPGLVAQARVDGRTVIFEQLVERATVPAETARAAQALGAVIDLRPPNDDTPGWN